MFPLYIFYIRIGEQIHLLLFVLLCFEYRCWPLFSAGAAPEIAGIPAEVKIENRISVSIEATAVLLPGGARAIIRCQVDAIYRAEIKISLWNCNSALLSEIDQYGLYIRNVCRSRDISHARPTP